MDPPEPAFASFAALDFSARSTPSPARPSADACWLGVAGREPAYARTRGAAWDEVAAWAAGATREGAALLGVDFALGLPAGTAGALDVGGWRGVWSLLEGLVADDAESNANNRFEAAARLNERIGAGAGPWWGCPPARASAWLTPRRGFAWPVVAASGAVLPRMRAADRACPGVQEVWKLLGAGSVGSQTLLGVAGLSRLRGRLAVDGVRLRVWPFERTFAPAAGELWVAEIWPGLLEAEVRASSLGIRDAAQVAAWVRWAERGAAGAWEVPLPEEAREEGWILRAGPTLGCADIWRSGDL